MAAVPGLILHGFFNSSAAYRVRIALGLKGLAYEHRGVNLRTRQQTQAEFLALNPAGLVPALEIGADPASGAPGRVISQSLAIIDYLDRLQPAPRLLPPDGPERDRVNEIALTIACDIHPLNNLRVLRHLVGPLGLSDAQKTAWAGHWIALGFDAVEALLPSDPQARWCVGAAPSLADCCLVPQVANARRMGIDIAAWPRIERIEALTCAHPAFAAAAPGRQPDHIPA